jgi:hypothetical protein
MIGRSETLTGEPGVCANDLKWRKSVRFLCYISDLLYSAAKSSVSQRVSGGVPIRTATPTWVQVVVKMFWW